MKGEPLRLLLADDDKDDCFLFEDALKEIPIPTHLVTVADGEKLMELLREMNGSALPDILFLDLNMPRKDGIQCMAEIKQHKALKDLPVVIFSTSLREDSVDILYKNGAYYYMRKPGTFTSFKKLIYRVLSVTMEDHCQPSREEFVINDR